MRHARFLMALPLLALSGAALWSTGCGTFGDDCAGDTGTLCGAAFQVKGTGGSSSSSSASSMTTTSSMMSSTSTGMDPGCAGDITEGLSAAEAERLISDKCGVFVQSDSKAATPDGTQAAPFKSLQAAIDTAGNSKRVYACSNATTPFAEAVTVAAAVEVYGGFDCSKGWTFKNATRSVITGEAKKVSLTLTDMAGGAMIEGFKITSANATGKTGESSIAVAVAAIDATLLECDVEAGNGAEGVPGVAPSGLATNGADAPVTDPMVISACINPAALTVGASGLTACDDGSTDGGPGGKGGITGTDSGNGQPGTDGTPANGVDGKGGPGQDAMNVCVNGFPGKPGDPGADGSAGTAVGSLLLSGISTAGADGTDGKPGSRGQGGGGGGGVKSSTLCPGSVDGNGASGGGGGAGGCGGKGGGAGKVGGSSIAIISLGTKLELTKVTLKSGKGGKGGDGAAGQGGGSLGSGGKGGAASGVAGSKAGCKGGDGGVGGDGGPGGGGRGGHSIGLAVVGVPASKTLAFVPGTPGDGGKAGTGGSPTGDGANGLGGSAPAACWDFSKNMTCAQ